MQEKVLKALAIIGLIGMFVSFFLVEQEGAVLYILNPVLFILICIDSVVPNLDEIMKTVKLRILFSIIASSIFIMPLLFSLKSMGILGNNVDTYANMFQLFCLGISAYFNFFFGTFKSKSEQK